MPAARAREGDVRTTNATTVERRSECELVVTRTITGPAHIVFAAWTTPDLLKQWWAPCSLGVTLLACEADVRVGGRYRHVFGPDEHHPVVFSGTYLEVTPHARLVYTQVFEPMRAAGEAIITLTLSEADGRTRVELHERYPSKAALDGALASGMEHGIRETLEQLAALVAAEAVLMRKADR
jgi:uncharacterized protein YndB with AHSA1/START domain